VQLGHGLVQAVLDPPLVHHQPVEGLLLGEVPRRHPPERQIDCRRRIAPGPQTRHPGVAGVGLDQIVQGLILHAFSPFEPPGEADDALGQRLFHRPVGSEFVEHLPSIQLELGRVFILDDGLAGQQAVLDGVLGDDGLALRRAGTGGLFGITTIGGNSCFAGHGRPSKITIYYL
jgi:hypothetical protein